MVHEDIFYKDQNKPTVVILFFSVKYAHAAPFATPVLTLLRRQIRIHRSHSSAFVSSTFRGLSPCRGAGALPEQLEHPSRLREVGWREYLCPPSHLSIPPAGAGQEGSFRALLTKNPIWILKTVRPFAALRTEMAFLLSCFFFSSAALRKKRETNF